MFSEINDLVVALVLSIMVYCRRSRCCWFNFEQCSFLIPIWARDLQWCLWTRTWPPADCWVRIQEESAIQFSHLLPIFYVSPECNHGIMGQERNDIVGICGVQCNPSNCCYLRFIPSSLWLVHLQGSHRFQSLLFSFFPG